MTASCVRCTRPMPDQAYVCANCAYRAGDQLHEIADMTQAARDIAHGLARHGGGGASGKPGSSLPFDLSATSRLDAMSNTIGGWARHVSESRGIGLPEPPVKVLDLMIGPLCRTRYECTHDSCKIMRDGDEWGWDLIVVAAQFLAGHVEWLRHRPEADEFLADVEACAKVVRGLARGPSEQKYLGPCGAPTQVEVTGLDQAEPSYMDGPPCVGDVYAHRGARVGRCRTCKAEVAASERETWLDGEVRSHAFRAAQIAEAYRVNVNTIRSWAARGQLVPHGHDGEDRPLFNVGDVLDLAAADAARREGERAKRARRAAVKAAEEASDAA